MNGRPVIGVTPDVELREEVHEVYFRGKQVFRALAEAGAASVMLPHHFDDVDLLLDRIDGLVVTGGGYQFQHPQLFAPEGPGAEPAHKWERTRFESAMLRGALARDLPVLGICGGFQTLNAVLGGRLVINLKAAGLDGLGHAGTPRDEVAHLVETRPGTLLRRVAGESFGVNSLHHQGLTEPDAGGVVSGVAPDGVVEAIEAPGARFVLGTQWHPEELVTEADRRVMRAFVEASGGA